MVVVLDGFDCWEFFFYDLVHEFPRFSCLIQYFLYFLIEEWTFGTFNCFLELLSVYQTPSWPIFLQVPTTIYILPTLQVPGDVDDFWVLFPCFFDGFSKWINDIFKWIYVSQVASVDSFDILDQVFDERFLFHTFFDNWVFPIVNVLFHNWYSDSKRGIIWEQSPIRMNDIVVQFLQTISEKH